MGKNKQYKKLRKIANRMPKFEANSQKAKLVQGSELIAAGVFEVEGQKVEYEKYYRQFTPDKIPINHSRNLKKEFNKNGKAGVMGYLNSVETYVRNSGEVAAKAIKENEEEQKQETL